MKYIKLSQLLILITTLNVSLAMLSCKMKQEIAMTQRNDNDINMSDESEEVVYKENPFQVIENSNSTALDSTEVQPNKHSSMNNKLYKGQLLAGEELQEYFFNDYLIAGTDFSLADISRKEEFESLLKELNLMRVETEDGLENSSQLFIQFKKTDNQPFSKESDTTLKIIRNNFGNSFGPVVYMNPNFLQGALNNQVIVKFIGELSSDKENEILKGYGCTSSFFMVDQQAYLVEFPRDWGYVITDVGKKMLANEQILYVENLYHPVPKSR